MTAKELINKLLELTLHNHFDTEVVYTYDSIYGHIKNVEIIDEHDWLPDPQDKIGKSLQKTGKKLVLLS